MSPLTWTYIGGELVWFVFWRRYILPLSMRKCPFQITKYMFVLFSEEPFTGGFKCTIIKWSWRFSIVSFGFTCFHKTVTYDGCGGCKQIIFRLWRNLVEHVRGNCAFYNVDWKSGCEQIMSPPAASVNSFHHRSLIASRLAAHIFHIASQIKVS